MRKALLMLALAVTCSTAFAQYGDIKFSGNIYSFYYMNLSSTKPAQNSFPQEGSEPAALNFNQFDIERIYLNVQSQLAASVKFRVTTDVFRTAAIPPLSGATTYQTRDTNGKVITVSVPAAVTPFYSGLGIRLKYGYFDWTPVEDLTFRMGMQGTPWFDFSEQVWKYRGVQQTAGDKNKFMSSSDLGFSANYNLPSKFGSLSAYVFNGNGYTSPELNRFKDVAVRLQIVPVPESEDLKGLKVTFMEYMGNNSAAVGKTTDANYQTYAPIKNNVLGAMLSYQGDQFNLGAEYLSLTTGTVSATTPINILDSTNAASVISIFGTLKAFGELKEYLELFARMDMYTPTGADISGVTDATATAANTKNTFLCIGLAYKPAAKLTIAADYQTTSYGHPIASQLDGTTLVNNKPMSASDSRFFIHGIITF